MPRGDHGNHARGEHHYRWRGGNPAPDPALRRVNAKASDARHPEHRRAREQVKDAVRRRALPRIGTCVCSDCGAPAAAYDHYLGYDQPLAVQPVCFPCHGKRSVARGEHKRRAGRKLDGWTWDEFPSLAAPA